MTPELYAALVSLAITTVGAVGLIVRAITLKVLERIEESKQLLKRNTEMTHEVQQATNGRLSMAVNRVKELTFERDNLRDMVNFVMRHPEGRKVLSEYTERRNPATQDKALAELLAIHLPADKRD
jgi:methylthioribose-1-phosphate isomerase